MDVIRLKGGRALNGKVTVGGAKNAALPIFAATLLTDEPCVLENVPDLRDIRSMVEIMQYLGAEVTQEGPHTWRIHAKVIGTRAPYELVRKMRASICLLGPMVSRMRKAEISFPGGCVIGPRPIDLHIKGLEKLSCDVKTRGGYVFVDAAKLKGGEIFLGGRQGSTVTGTENILMAAVLAPGTTCIDSAACEPEVEDLCRMLIGMGAKIEGVGSHRLIIHGVKKLHGVTHSIIPDRIEAGTYLLAGLMTKGDVTVEGARARDLSAFIDKLEEAGQLVQVIDDNTLRIRAANTRLHPVDIITLPHPGFPTDLQAQMCALMAQTPGLSIITERVYPNRFMHVPELQRMGADIAIEGPSAIIKGDHRLSGAPVMASDLRASAALILAGLTADTGETWVQRIYHLDRGYEKMDVKLQSLGADIERLNESAMPNDLKGEE